MIQILGIRTYKRDGIIKKKESLFSKNWRAASVSELFKNIEHYIGEIEEVDRYNLYYTAALCEEKKGRVMINQSIIPYDVDGIDCSRIEEYIEPILFAIGGLQREEVGIVFSGNGIQVIVESTELITNVEYFNDTRLHYKSICARIDKELEKMKLPGSADPAVWSPARLLRLPMTRNIKTPFTGYANKNSTKEATLYTRILIPQDDYTVERVAGVTPTTLNDHIAPEALVKYPPPDTRTVLSECAFMRHCAENQETLSEENWYKMLSITCRLDNAYDVSHNMSKYHPAYSQSDCDNKIEQAKRSSGPRTCANISTSFEGCHKCDCSVISPILIKGADYIATKSLGFRTIKSVSPSGKVTMGGVVHEDLLKYFCQCHDYIVTPEGLLYLWTGKYWQYESDSYIDHFAEDNVMNPSPKNVDCSEFRSKVFRNYIQKKEWFNNTTFRKINLNNGILDLNGIKPLFVPHSKECGFTHVLPYDYDESATCPTFDMFLRDVTMDNEQMEQLLLEFAGYAVGNENCTLAKSLVLVGEGANGKSTFLDVLKEIVGDDAYSSVGLGDLGNEQNRAMLEGKLFNLVEEAPYRAFLDSHNFKNIVSGGTITVKRVFKEPYCIKNRCKIVMACNDLPMAEDMSEGFLRRLIIVPFERHFDDDERDIFILDKMKLELAGILNKIILGHQRLKDQRRFTTVKAVKDKIEDFKVSNDIILRFMQENVANEENSVGDHITTDQIFSAFINFCGQNNIKVTMDKFRFAINFSKKLKSAGLNAVKWRSHSIRGYTGIILTSGDSLCNY